MKQEILNVMNSVFTYYHWTRININICSFIKQKNYSAILYLCYNMLKKNLPAYVYMTVPFVIFTYRIYSNAL